MGLSARPWFSTLEQARSILCPAPSASFALLLGCVHVLGEGNLMRLVVKSFPPNVQLGCLGKRMFFKLLVLFAENMAAQREWTPMVSSR